jgi:phosphopentomutase
MSATQGRVIWIVLDGVGVGELPDAGDYGDRGAATVPHVAAAAGGLSLPNLQRLGLGNLAAIAGVPPRQTPAAVCARLAERSAGKDSIVGHWELAGVTLEEPFATFPHGFPEALIDAFATLAGKRPLGNLPAGGISVLKQFGAEHLVSGRPIVYTSVDSVFQIAVHEDVMPAEELHALCRAVKPLTDAYGIARVIARPFTGSPEAGFRRTSRRKDFPSPPPSQTLLELLSSSGFTVATVGKISDIFAGRGISSSISTVDNADGMAKTLEALATLDDGLLMVNLIDFDMAYGHRNDVAGFARALQEFDAWLPSLCARMRDLDLLVVCADHGCDPTTQGTDHSREYVPALCWSPSLRQGCDLGRRESFADVAATLAELFGLEYCGAGSSFAVVSGLAAGVRL